MEAEEKSKPTVKLMILAAVSFGVCSGTTNFTNKLLLNIWSFNHPGVILLFQMLFLIAGLKLLEILGKIRLVPYNYENAKSCALLSLLYSLNTCLALFALSGMNIPMYGAMRRCVPLASLFLSYCVFTKKPSLSVFVSVIVITIGVIVAATGDLQFDAYSYLMGVSSALLMAAYLTTLQYDGVKKHLSSTDLLYINSVNSLPIMVVLSLGSIKKLSEYEYKYEWGFLCSFLLVIITGCLLNYTMFLCTTVNSALTTSLVGVIKSGFATVFGMFAFGGVTPTVPLLVGLITNFLGGIMFTYAKYQQNLHQESSSAG